VAIELPYESKLAHNVGLVVLSSQHLERHLKVLAACGDSNLSGPVSERYRRLFRRPMGEVVSIFLDSVTATEGSVPAMEAYLRSLLDRRNKVVHHFYETYGCELEAGRRDEVLSNLGQLVKELRAVAKALEGANRALMERLLEDDDGQS
jgi:hypothetical protein